MLRRGVNMDECITTVKAIQDTLWPLLPSALIKLGNSSHVSPSRVSRIDRHALFALARRGLQVRRPFISARRGPGPPPSPGLDNCPSPQVILRRLLLDDVQAALSLQTRMTLPRRIEQSRSNRA